MMKERLVRMWCILTVFSLGLLGCSGGGSKPECNEDTDCKGIGERCDPVTHKCLAACVMECGDRKCGPDPVCAKSCGACPVSQTCDSRGRCVDACTPDCSGRDCGLDPVCRQIDCGTCTSPEVCNLVKGTCIKNCTPDCGERTCGLDPVCSALDCGSCSVPDVCDKRTGFCGPPCRPDCGDRQCGLDPVCEELSCGTCDAPEICDESTGTCKGACVPDCGGRQCGMDPACGVKDCGTCEKPLFCNSRGECDDPADHPGAPCPNGARDCPPQWPFCISGFFSSYCTLGCTGDEKCGSGNCCLKVGENGDFCFDPTQCPSIKCDPVAQTGCPGDNCVPWAATDTMCIPVGPQRAGQPCSDTVGNRCQVGNYCAGLGDNVTCHKLCDTTSGEGCAEGEPCLGIVGIVRWGICVPVKKCEMKNMGADCLADETCTLLSSDCSLIGCFLSGGKTEGQSCEFGNSCAKGLLCVSKPAFCAKVCTRPEATECTAPEICDVVEGCETTWGVCVVP